MHRYVFWLGLIFLVSGVLVVAASGLMAYHGLSTTINLGDPAEYQFYLVPVWQIGAAVAALGLFLFIVGRRGTRSPQAK